MVLYSFLGWFHCNYFNMWYWSFVTLHCYCRFFVFGHVLFCFVFLLFFCVVLLQYSSTTRLMPTTPNQKKNRSHNVKIQLTLHVALQFIANIQKLLRIIIWHFWHFKFFSHKATFLTRQYTVYNKSNFISLFLNDFSLVWSRLPWLWPPGMF